MSEYTPDREEIIESLSPGFSLAYPGSMSDAECREAVERGIAAIEREAAARAWDEGYVAGDQDAGNGIAGLLTGLPTPEPITNPYRAAEIREEKR